MPVGASIALTATVVYSDATSYYANGSVTWTSSNTSMVTLDPSSIGTIHAVGAGTPVVTASLFGLTGTASVTVKASPVASIVVSPATATVAPMSTPATFTANATLQDGTPIDVTAMARWSSTDPNIASGGGG